jgi:hypothetical protein
MPGDQPIAESAEPKVDALGWPTKNADLAFQISSPELILVLPALVTLQGDLGSSHLGCNKGN